MPDAASYRRIFTDKRILWINNQFVTKRII